MKHNSSFPLTQTQRKSIAFVSALLAASFLASCDRQSSTPTAEAAKSKNGDLTVVSYGGGAYQESHKKALIDPFSARSGAKIESVVWGAEYGRLQEMVRSGKVVWDVVEVTAAQFNRGEDEKLFEPLSVELGTTVFVPLPGGPSPSPVGVPNVFWSTVMAYPIGFFPSPPQSWKDFWDTKAFPGPRALYDDPRGNLEFALLADGVQLEELYPLDVDRAFRKLDRIREEVLVWWSDGTEPVRLLVTGQVVLASAWSGRIFASEQARSEISYSWRGAAHELDYWVIPRGSANVELASRFIEFASNPEPMAAQAALTAYGPSNSLALQHVSQDVMPYLPTAEPNWSISFVINADWWSKYEEEMATRWVLWKNQ